MSRGHLNIVKYLINEQKVPLPNIGARTVCEAGRGRHLDVVKYLIEEQHCSRGDALHEAVSYRHVHVVEYLLSTGKVDSQQYEHPVISTLVDDVCLLEIVTMCEEFACVRAAFPVEDFVKGLLLDHPSAGKSTLAKTFQQRASSLLPPILGQFRNVSGVEAHTAGIIPIQLYSKELGHMVLYDFAGQPEYYASHTAVLHNLLQGTPAVFLCVVDMSESEERVLREVHYWISFIENEASRVLSRSRVIVVGSHVDVVREKRQNLERKCREITRVGKEYLGRGVFGGIVTLDCCKLGGEGLRFLLSILGSACHDVRENSRADISLYCHMPLSFLQKRVKAAACTIREFSSHIYSCE